MQGWNLRMASLEAAGTLVAAAPSPDRGLRVGRGGGVVVEKDTCQTKFQFCRVLQMGGIELRLLSMWCLD